MKRFNFILLVAFLLCSSFCYHHDPYNPAAGKYKLVTYNGKALPANYNAGKTDETLLSETLIISEDDNWTLLMIIESTTNPERNYSEIMAGRCRIISSGYEFFETCGDKIFSGNINGEKLLLKITDHGKSHTYLFQKVNTVL